MSAKIAVLGGGVAGVVVAGELARQGAEVDVLERLPRLGGLHRSFIADGMSFDIGAFVFNKRHDVFHTFPSLLPLFRNVKCEMVALRASGMIDQYPMSIGGYYADYGLKGLIESTVDLLSCKVKYRKRDSVPAFAKYYMGEKIYERAGLKHYIERLYGVADDEVGIEFARQRLQAIEAFTLVNIAKRMASKSWKKLSRTPEPTPWTLVRPVQGFDHVYDLIHDELESRGVDVRLNCSVRSIRRTPFGFDVDLSGEVRTYDRVISTIPIPVAQRLIGLKSDMACDSMNLHSMFYSGHLTHPGALQFNFTSTARWKRITAYSKYYGQVNGRDYWSVETTTKDVSPANLASIRAEFESHARANGLIHGELHQHGEMVTERAYPVFRPGDGVRVQAERNKLMAFGLDFVGRQGAFEFLSSEEVAAKAKQLAAVVNVGSLQDAIDHVSEELPR